MTMNELIKKYSVEDEQQVTALQRIKAKAYAEYGVRLNDRQASVVANSRYDFDTAVKLLLG